MGQKPTTAQVRFMENLIAGRPTYHGCKTKSDWGGLSSTLGALDRRGWIDRPTPLGSGEPFVTETGYQALEAHYGEAIPRPHPRGADDNE